MSDEATDTAVTDTVTTDEAPTPEASGFSQAEIDELVAASTGKAPEPSDGEGVDTKDEPLKDVQKEQEGEETEKEATDGEDDPRAARRVEALAAINRKLRKKEEALAAREGELKQFEAYGGAKQFMTNVAQSERWLKTSPIEALEKLFGVTPDQLGEALYTYVNGENAPPKQSAEEKRLASLEARLEQERTERENWIKKQQDERSLSQRQADGHHIKDTLMRDSTRWEIMRDNVVEFGADEVVDLAYKWQDQHGGRFNFEAFADEIESQLREQVKKQYERISKYTRPVESNATAQAAKGPKAAPAQESSGKRTLNNSVNNAPAPVNPKPMTDDEIRSAALRKVFGTDQ